MWRALFLAIGFFLMIVGMECLGVESARLRLHDKPPPSNSLFEDTSQEKGELRVLRPPPWAPWSLMSCGAVVCIYSFTLPKKIAGN